jgi:hypothetical protein
MAEKSLLNSITRLTSTIVDEGKKDDFVNIDRDFVKKQYSVKLVISGKIVEWFEYERPQPSLYDNSCNINIPISEEEARAKNYAQVKKRLIRLIWSNENLNKFITLTLRENIGDLKITNPLFNDYINKMRKVYPNFNYICVPEFQERGAVHYHTLNSLPFIPAKKIADLWSNGFIRVKRVNRIKNLARYMTKYLTKDLFDGRLYRQKKFFCSVGIKQPVVVYDDLAVSMISRFDDLKKQFQYDYKVPFIGNIRCVQYINEGARRASVSPASTQQELAVLDGYS